MNHPTHAAMVAAVRQLQNRTLALADGHGQEVLATAVDSEETPAHAATAWVNGSSRKERRKAQTEKRRAHTCKVEVSGGMLSVTETGALDPAAVAFLRGAR